MPPRLRPEKPAKHEEVDILTLQIKELHTHVQKQISQLHNENGHLQKKLESTVSDLTDVVTYLKNTIEEKDEDIARLEELIGQQNKTRIEAIRREKEENEEKMTVLEAEREGLKTQIAMLSTQLTSQERMTIEMEEMRREMELLKETAEQRRIAIDEMENNERVVKIRTTEIVRHEMIEELEQEVANMREQLRLEKDAQFLMNQGIIEHLQREVGQLTEGKKVFVGKWEAAELEIQREKASKEAVEKERDNLRRLLEKNGITTEKNIKDMKKRIEDLENRRKKVVQEQADITANLNKQITELQELLRNSNKRCEILEKRLLEEKQARTATVAAHSSQNAKIAELKDFLTICLAGDPLADMVLGESRTAVFGQLSLIVSQIPTVK